MELQIVEKQDSRTVMGVRKPFAVLFFNIC